MPGSPITAPEWSTWRLSPPRPKHRLRALALFVYGGEYPHPASMPAKRALVVGVDYRGQSIALSGCANDAYAWAAYFAGAGYEVTLLVDDSNPTGANRKEWERDHGKPAGAPTRANILCHLVRLLTADTGALAFTFSGHGTQMADTSGDEKDGKDEVLCPVDMQAGEYITDDALRGVWQLMRPGQQVVAVQDCCHSGTGMDLPYQLYDRGGASPRFLREDGAGPDTPGAVFLLSGCADSQTSAESSITNAETRRAETRGALSAAALGVLQKYRGRVGVAQLLDEVRATLKKGGHTQIAQMSAGRDASPRALLL